MKKTLLLLFALVGGVVSSSAVEVIIATDFPGGTISIATFEDAGLIDTDIVSFYLEDNTGTNHDGWGMGGLAESSSWTPVETFTGNGTAWVQSCTFARIKEVANTESGIRILLYNGVELKQIVANATFTFAEPRTITYDGGGFIAASEFDGLVDTDRIRFTYTVSGDLTGYENWGIGSIGSNDDPHTVKIADLPASALGDLTYTCSYADLKSALVATPDGILFKTWNFNSGQATATRKKVEILKSCVPVTFGVGKTYVSFASSQVLDFTDVDGLTAYQVLATGVTASSVSLTAVNSAVPAATGLILAGTAGTTYNIPVAASGTALSSNKLVGVTTDTAIGGDGVYDYILQNGTFYHASAGTLAAGKAYLHLDAAPSSRESLDIVIDGMSTGISNIKVGTEDNVYYDLQGRRVLYPTKGLYIVNGKKVIVK